jgi:hypothetical protein
LVSLLDIPTRTTEMPPNPDELLQALY